MSTFKLLRDKHILLHQTYLSDWMINLHPMGSPTRRKCLPLKSTNLTIYRTHKDIDTAQNDHNAGNLHPAQQLCHFGYQGQLSTGNEPDILFPKE
ncbi:MAG TPA: hypothetical protein V6C90_19935 [Coleofasciculaceae cyanobacterium]